MIVDLRKASKGIVVVHKSSTERAAEFEQNLQEQIAKLMDARGKDKKDKR